ncbi:type I restriction enzyme HsdR N-terminal domain-containing protein [Spongiactinospora sp. TRM90649]|uniref:type I restriction enzyme HsdR N-terminal domain-containing protein n=1 Tax=Spongiactinospora sp. TRM90649 TaxID=3031114 RepID=UPI0023F935AC|nr:type I restriction enzyme HsdR N-terminal domain-containing protein [Spongiactinospora sp. TRM90649]MDF5759084.1 type I restriction enzyme HsdR N-terminal domain-containing protein [Spongiactinospora sp. TRM90649]
MSEQAAQPVVEGEAPTSTARKAPAVKVVPKWESDARSRVRAAVRRFNKPLNDLVVRDANEGDTRLLITDFLCEALGYDKYEDLTTEYQVKGEFADYGVRIDKQLVAFIEVKRCSQKLTAKHLRQVQMYAVNEGVEWMILSNGQVWRAYHMTPGLPVAIDLALEADLLDESSLASKADVLFYLTKEAFKRRLIDDLWKARAATSPRSLAQALLSETVIDAVRKELRRQTGYNADVVEIHRILRDEILQVTLSP